MDNLVPLRFATRILESWNIEVIGSVLDKVFIKFMRLDNSADLPLPGYESEGSSGMDIRACVKEPVILQPGEIKLIPTGLAVAIPLGYEAQMRPRSGLALKHGIGLVNSPGTVDSDYRGEIGIVMINWGENPFTIRRGDRIAQMVVTKVCRAGIVEVEGLDDTQRGEGGFGHSGVE
jgi:dUTP pyrophosphatase